MSYKWTICSKCDFISRKVQSEIIWTNLIEYPNVLSWTAASLSLHWSLTNVETKLHTKYKRQKQTMHHIYMYLLIVCPHKPAPHGRLRLTFYWSIRHTLNGPTSRLTRNNGQWWIKLYNLVYVCPSKLIIRINVGTHVLKGWGIHVLNQGSKDSPHFNVPTLWVTALIF